MVDVIVELFEIQATLRIELMPMSVLVRRRERLHDVPGPVLSRTPTGD